MITALGRLGRSADTAAAAAELRAINRRIFPLWQSSYQDRKATWTLMDLKQYVIGDVGSTLTIAQGPFKGTAGIPPASKAERISAASLATAALSRELVTRAW